MNTYKVSICILGDSYSGKSTFLNYVDKGFFKECYHKTLGVEFVSKSYIIENNVLKFYFWDLAGSDKFKTITSSYFNNTSIFLLFFDLNNIRSFFNLKSWLCRIEKNNLSNNYKIILIGNKNDLKKKVSNEEILNLINKYKFLNYLDVSLKNENDINKIILLIKDYCSYCIDTQQYQQIGIKLINKKEKKKESYYNYFSCFNFCYN